MKRLAIYCGSASPADPRYIEFLEIGPWRDPDSEKVRSMTPGACGKDWAP
ncbi:MAG: hypothetical protein AAF687_05735 [Pseudomonadota bacterium]